MEPPVMIMDVYNCEECTVAFAIEEGIDVKCCPNCESELFEYSHTSEASFKDMKAESA